MTNTSLLQEIILSNLQSDATLDVESLKALVEGIENDVKRKELLKQHPSPIKQLPNGRWYTRINGKKYERTKKEDLENLIVNSFKTENRQTLISLFNSYLELRKQIVSPTTWRKEINYFKKYLSLSDLGQKSIEDITIDDGYTFLRYCLTIKPEMKRRYWNNLNSFLNQMFQYCIDRRMIPDNPIRNMHPRRDYFDPPKKTRDGDTVFNRIEQKCVCELAEDDALTTKVALPLGIIILFNLGLRDGELCALKWGDVEKVKESQFIHVQREMVENVTEEGKTKGVLILDHCKTPAGDRRLPVNAKCMETLNQIRELNEKKGIPTSDDDFILLRKEKGKILPCTSRCIDSRLRKYCKNAGMSVIKSPHDIRRTVLTNLYQAGMPLKKIQEFAGHATLQQTLEYLRNMDDDLDTLKYVETLSEENPTDIIPFRRPA